MPGSKPQHPGILMISLTDAQLFSWLTSFLLPLFRILGMFSAAPVISNRAFSIRARVGLAAAIALLVAPSTGSIDPTALAGSGAYIVVAREFLIGVTIGFFARLMFASFEVAGEIIGLQMGLSFAGFFDPQSGSANAVGRFVNTMSLFAFVALNGPLAIIATVVESFNAFPVGEASFEFLAKRAPWELGSQIFSLALSLALPFITLLLFITLSLGVVSRVAPQFNIFAIGFPITIGAGLMLLTVGMPALEAPITAALELLMSFTRN